MAKHLYQKGKEKLGGRQKGTPNKVTRETKEVIADLLKLTAPIYAELLIEKARSNNSDERVEFMTRFEKLIEFDVPKLQRSEVKAAVEASIEKAIQINVNGIDIDLSK